MGEILDGQVKLLLSSPRGFCAGVVRAIDTVKKALNLWGAPIYVKHEIVHNKHVVNELRDMGAVFIEDLSEVPEGERIIYSAHGIPPSVRDEAKKRNLIEIDASCGLVIRVHSAAKRYAAKGYHIILIGHKTHVEVIGTAGEVPGQCSIVESPEDVAELDFGQDQKLFYLTQTTLSLDDVAAIRDALLEKFPQIETLPSSSICYATTNRQMALRSMIDQVEVVFVVGDPMSSNSNRLVEVAVSRGVKGHLINHPDDIREEWLEGARQIGLTAGASTPEEIVQDCIERLKELGVEETEEVVYKEEDVFFKLPKMVDSSI